MSQFRYFLSHITVLLSKIHLLPQDKSNFLQVHVLHNFMKYFSGARVYEKVKNCLVFAICYLWVHKNISLQNIFAQQKNRWCWKLAIGMFLRKWRCHITLYLFAGFKSIFLCSIHSLWFVKYVFTANIWFVKFYEYKSQDVKSNPGNENWKPSSKSMSLSSWILALSL